MIAVTIVLAIVNVLFAIRCIEATSRSRGQIAPVVPDSVLPSLSIVVPARNEERQIERCIRSLLAQSYGELEVVAVDDRSDDATPAILRELAAEDPRLRVVEGAPLPPGWAGKPWAVSQGACVARGAWLLFTDADTEHEPAAAASAVSHALACELDVLSLLPDQVLGGIAERAILPSIFLTILLGTGATGDVADPAKPHVAIFNGQYILVARKAYDAIGGHASVRAEIAEDLELARTFKRDGRFRIALEGAAGLVRTRMYRSFSEIWNGFVKNFALGARGRMGEAVFGTAILALVSPVTPIWAALLAVLGRAPQAAALAAAFVLSFVAIGISLRRARFGGGNALTLPLGLPVAVAIFTTSLLRYRFGRGVVWRGRTYDRSFSSSP